MDYLYDARHRLLTVNPDSGGGNADASYAYDPVGNQARMQSRNGVATAYSYNTRNQLTFMNSTLVGSGNPVAAFTYDDASWVANRRLANSGLRRRMAESIGGAARTIDYDYDNLKRLTQETIGAGSIRYDGQTPLNGNGPALLGYDTEGNRRSRRSTVTGVPTTANNVPFDVNDRLDNDATPTTVSTYFDANGNTTI